MALAASFDSGVHAYSAKAPRHAPNTVVARLELRDVSSHLFHLAGHIDAELREPWGSQSSHEAEKVGLSPHEMPVQWVD